MSAQFSVRSTQCHLARFSRTTTHKALHATAAAEEAQRAAAAAQTHVKVRVYSAGSGGFSGICRNQQRKKRDTFGGFSGICRNAGPLVNATKERYLWGLWPVWSTRQKRDTFGGFVAFAEMQARLVNATKERCLSQQFLWNAQYEHSRQLRTTFGSKDGCPLFFFRLLSAPSRQCRNWRRRCRCVIGWLVD